MEQNQSSFCDQLHIHCPVCGKEIPFDKWSDEPQDWICSDECRETIKEIFGIRSKFEVMVERASDPLICCWCRGPLADKTSRVDALYCSPRCQKAAKRVGIEADKLREIRLSAIEYQEKRP